MSERQLTLLAALNMMVAVGAGAFGAHRLKRMLSPGLLVIWQTGVSYHLVHALGLFIVALMMGRFTSSLLATAGLLMFVGIVLFCGSLYVLALTGMRPLGMVTPLGGVAFLLVWALIVPGAPTTGHERLTA